MAEKTKSKNALRPVTDEARALFELADEEMMMQQLAGVADEKYIYKFPGKDGEQVGLSILGVNAACRQFSKKGEFIRILDHPKIELDKLEPDEYIVATVRAQRFALLEGKEVALDSAIGSKRQWRMMRTRTGSVIPNDNFVEHAISKAERNAKRKLIPEKTVVDFIKKCLNAKAQVQNVSAQNNRRQPPPRRHTSQKPPDRPAETPQQPPQPKPQSGRPAQAPSGSQSADSRAAAVKEMYDAVGRLGFTKQSERNAVAQSLLREFKSSKDVPLNDIKAVTASIRATGTEDDNKPNRLEFFQDGKARIVQKSDEKTLWPRGIQEEPQGW